MATTNTACSLAYGCLHAHVRGSWNQGENVYLAKHNIMPLANNVYLTDSERATNEEASIRENELSARTLTNPRTQVTNQHSFRIRTRGAKGPYERVLATRKRVEGSIGTGGFCRQKNWQNSVLFLVSLMHVWYVDKEMEQNSRNCPPNGLYGSANFTAFFSRICHRFEHNPPVPRIYESVVDSDA